MRVAVTFILIELVSVNPALAWSEAGHKIIASIAFRQLTAAQQTKVVAILKKHPRFNEDFTDQMPDEIRRGDESTQHEWLFQQAAVWPDLVRPPGPEERIAFHRPEWHYINLPHFLNDAARAELEGRLELNLALDPPTEASLNTARMNVVQAIRLARMQCADASANPQARGVLLAWLFHDVGDIHQPLHSTALFSRRLFASGDRGGNLIKIEQEYNLHSLWDQFPGRAADFREARNRAIAHLADADLAGLGRNATAALNETEWLDESHFLAVAVVYDAEVIVPLRMMEQAGGDIDQIKLSDDYLKMGGRISTRRVVQAGYRLAAVLKQIVAE